MAIGMRALVLAPWHIEIDLGALRRRLWEIIPGFLSWTTLIGLSVLALLIPFWIAIFIIAYDVYILIRAGYMAVHLVYAYRRLRREATLPWRERGLKISRSPGQYLQELRVAEDSAVVSDRQERRHRREHREAVEHIVARHLPVLDWHAVHHAVILPTYDESLTVLRSSLTSLAATDWPRQRLHVAVGFEARAGAVARQRAQKLREEFAHTFGTFLTTFHPDGLPGEARVKSANATWAMQRLEKRLGRLGISVDHVLVSNFDSDTVISPTYFSYLTYVFITRPDRYRLSYQPLPLYHNNVWDAPAFSRVIATGSTFWQMIESTRPERLVTFSSHSMTLRALKAVGYWQRDIVSEDSRIFWQCLLKYDGRYRTYPLYTTVSMDAALADTWWQTLINQYRQKRRWAWGIENFPYLVEGLIHNQRIPRRVQWRYLFRTLEGHHSWATAPIIVAGLGWLPIFFGGPEWHSTVLSYTLPYMARTIMSIAMVGLVVSSVLNLLLLPPRPPGHSPWRYVGLAFQWALVPFIATFLSALPALDAETRLMLGRDLHFNVMKKSRKEAR